MKIINEAKNSIAVAEMADGQIGVITEWQGTTGYNGRVVQRYGDHLITLGESSRDSWTGFFLGAKPDPECRVRILPKGTSLEV